MKEEIKGGEIKGGGHPAHLSMQGESSETKAHSFHCSFATNAGRMPQGGWASSPTCQRAEKGDVPKARSFHSPLQNAGRMPAPLESRLLTLLLLITLILALTPAAFGVERFPPPDFSSHAVPLTVVPDPQTRGVAWLDVLVLSVGLGVASWLSLKQRSRRGIVILSLLSLAYFGFWRRGCVCAIGSIQNVALGIADPT